MLSWVPGNLFYFFLPIWWGLEGTAALRAIFNLLLPVLHGIGALGVLLLPALVRVRGTPVFRRSLITLAAVFTGFAAVYWLALFAFGETATNWLYESRYDEYMGLLPILGLLPFATGLVAVLGGALRAIERPDLVFWAYVGSSLTALLIGLPLIARLGPLGGAVAQVAAASVTVHGLLWAVAIVRRPK
jgi:O-antigen/teichoic acid export membrane protein